VPAAEVDLVSAAKRDAAKAVPLRLEHVLAALRELADQASEHRPQWWREGNAHAIGDHLFRLDTRDGRAAR
jgi:hypothetical protein